MKVKQILEQMGFKPPMITKSEWDGKRQCYVQTQEPNDQVVLNYGDVHADTKALLRRNMDRDVEHYTMVGPIALFAFKIRGPDMALIMVNTVPLGGMGYKIARLNRYGSENEFDRILAMLVDKSKMQLSTDSTQYFQTWITLQKIGGDSDA